jgi:hypothetical protein
MAIGGVCELEQLVSAQVALCDIRKTTITSRLLHWGIKQSNSASLRERTRLPG